MNRDSSLSSKQTLLIKLWATLKEVIIKKEAQAVTNKRLDKSEILYSFKKLLLNFWEIDKTFSLRTREIEDKKKSETDSTKRDYDSINDNLNKRKDKDLQDINFEEKLIIDLSNSKREEISDIFKNTQDELSTKNLEHRLDFSNSNNMDNINNLISIRELEALIPIARESAKTIKIETENYKEWQKVYSKVVTSIVVLVIIVVIGIVIMISREINIGKDYNNGKTAYNQQSYHLAIERFESLKNRRSFIRGDNYYQEVRPLLLESYYQIATYYLVNEQRQISSVLNANAAIDKLIAEDPNYKAKEVEELNKEVNYLLGIEAMKNKQWSYAISFFNFVGKNYKSTAKFLQECNRKLNRDKLATNTTPPSKSSKTQSIVEDYSTSQTTQKEFILQPDQEKGIDVWITNIYSGGGQDNEILRVGGWGDKYCSLLRFDLEGLSLMAFSAKIYLYNFGNAGYKDSNVSMNLERVVTTWNENTKWQNKPSSEFLRLIPMPSFNSWYEIDITDLYNGWQAGEFPNYGILLCPTATNNYFNEFYSSDFIRDPLLRPKLVIKTQK